MTLPFHVRCCRLRHEVAFVPVVPGCEIGRQPAVLSVDPTRTCGQSNLPVRSSWNNVASLIRVVSEPRGDGTTASVRAVGS